MKFIIMISIIVSMFAIACGPGYNNSNDGKRMPRTYRDR